MHKLIIFSSMLMLGIGTGCRKDFLTEAPRAIIAPDNLYVNKAGF